MREEEGADTAEENSNGNCDDDWRSTTALLSHQRSISTTCHDTPHDDDSFAQRERETSQSRH